MGFVRFALAVIVLISHAGYQEGSIGALASVEAFFILSGTYMCAVWRTRYAGMPSRIFFTSRAMRLWPTYLTIFLFTFLCYLIWGAQLNDNNLFDLFRDIKAHGFTRMNSLMLFISVILFGQDILSLAEPVHFMLPVRQSWSIASELLFYLTVPLIFRGHRFIMLLVGFAALMLCKYLLMTTYGWRYSYFLPVGNLGYFLLGGSLYYVSQLSLVEKLKARLSSWRNPLMLIFILFQAALKKNISPKQESAR